MRPLWTTPCDLTACLILLTCCIPATCATIHVNGYTGSDSNDGSTWALSRKTIQSSIDLALAGDQVWVAGYVHKECITLKDGVALYGGFRGTETELAQRPPCPAPTGSICETIIDGRSRGSVVTIPANAGPDTIIDGFTIRNGSSSVGGGIMCQIASRAIIRNNVIRDNLALSRNGLASAGGGIGCALSSAPTISNNVITGNMAVGSLSESGQPIGGDGGGIGCMVALPTITGNMILDNRAVGLTADGARSGNGGGIACLGPGGSAVISDNNVHGNTANSDGGGIHCTQTARITANSVRQNSAMNGKGGGVSSSGEDSLVMANRVQANSAAIGGGLFCGSGTAVSNIISGNKATERGGGVTATGEVLIINNTIVENDCSNSELMRGAIYCSGSAVVANNIIAFNSGMISGLCTSINNRPYRSPSGTGVPDPKLRGGNVHIQADSTCREAGDNSLIQPDWIDIDGQPRVQGSVVDIGADESDGTTWDRIVYVTANGDDANDGSSWRYAKRSVQNAIDAAASLEPETCRNEVWVAAGTYHGTVNLKLSSWPAAEIGLYGGFAGTEGDMADRDWRRNSTVLDGDQLDSVVVVAEGATNHTVIDGFTITNGKGHGTGFMGGGVYMKNASPIISHNIIRNNGVSGKTSRGAGICSEYANGHSSAIITENEIRENRAFYGGGIFSNLGAAAIIGNVIASNVASGSPGGGSSGGGIHSRSSTVVIANNLIANNSASYRSGGLEILGGNVYNNTIIGNSAPIGGAVLAAYGNEANVANNIICFNSTGISLNPLGRSYNCICGNGGTDTLVPTERAVDPLLGADGRISRLSPCVNAGSDSIVLPDWTDRDGQARVQGTHVDIGADESDGTYWPVLVYVSPTGSDDNPGRSWALPKATLGGAYQIAQPGDEVWVAKGSYSMGSLLSEIAFYGGFAGSEVCRDERDPGLNETMVVDWLFQTLAGTTEKAVVDGFILTDTHTRYGGIECREGSATISNNTITGCSGSYSAVIWAGNDTVIRNNKICLNSCQAIYCPPDSSPTITANRISANTEGGIICYGSGGLISGNNITGNSSAGTSAATATGAGIRLTGTITAAIHNNTITANSMARSGAVYFVDCDASGASFANNLIASNGSGVVVSGTCLLPAFISNCVWGNELGNYVGMTDPTGALGNICADPRLASLAFGDGHIQPDSPCRGAGTLDAIIQPVQDYDGQSCLADGSADIGADNSDGTQWDVSRVIRVSTTGSDANDGSSWALAKKTIQAAVTQAATTGAEVWVAAGTYKECVRMGAHVYLYGGFAGTETSRTQRNWDKNKTTIDAQLLGAVLGYQTGHLVSRVDGFTLTRGKELSLGMFGTAACMDSSILFCNNIVTANTGTTSGLRCSDSGSIISNNLFAANTSASNVCLYCVGPVRLPTIASNTMVGNIGNAIYLTTPTTARALSVCSNIIARSGGVRVYSGVADLRNNDIYPSSYIGVQPGQGDISADPLFVDEANGDYHLSPASPCINKGWNGAPVLQPLDMDNEGRICQGLVDIGADEYWPSELPIGSVKGAPDGAIVHGSGAVVSAAFPDLLYLEQPDRASGIRVEKTDHGLTVGATTEVSGTVETNADGERYIAASSIADTGTGAIGPVAVPNASLGGGPLGLQEGVSRWRVEYGQGASQQIWIEATGLNNIGLLVRTTGRIIPELTTPNSFTIDDGSQVLIKCILPDGVTVDPVWSYVGVTGACSCEKVLVDGRYELHAVVLVRGTDDITPF